MPGDQRYNATLERDTVLTLFILRHLWLSMLNYLPKFALLNIKKSTHKIISEDE